MSERIDVGIIGGGIGGLACARALSRAGLTVRIFERRATLGGRAACVSQGGFHLDQGPHALYCAGGGMTVLRDLGISPKGAQPPTSGRCLLADGDAVLPAGPMSILRFTPLSLGGRFALARAFMRAISTDAAEWDARPISEWLAQLRPGVAKALAMFVRLVTYAHAPGRLSAGAALRALQAGQKGVLYLDGGWQSLVDDLAAGLDVRQARVDAVHGGPGAREIITADDERVIAGAIVVAAGPAAARRLIGSTWSGAPIRLASLTVALDHPPTTRFALGYDAPVYFSVPSQTARQAPPGAAVAHVARYLAPDDAAADVGPLEAILDRVAPGWRAAERHRRFLPRITVSHHLPLAETGGVAGRAPVEVAPDLFQVGDWVGRAGQLVDASLCSARAAADAILARRVCAAA